MILDQRLLSRSYGKVILASLPPFSRTRSQALACAFVSGLAGVPRDGPAPEARSVEEG
jgi:Rad3-related DNA helicase